MDEFTGQSYREPEVRSIRATVLFLQRTHISMRLNERARPTSRSSLTRTTSASPRHDSTRHADGHRRRRSAVRLQTASGRWASCSGNDL